MPQDSAAEQQKTTLQLTEVEVMEGCTRARDAAETPSSDARKDAETVGEARDPPFWMERVQPNVCIGGGDGGDGGGGAEGEGGGA